MRWLCPSKQARDSGANLSPSVRNKPYDPSIPGNHYKAGKPQLLRETSIGGARAGICLCLGNLHTHKRDHRKQERPYEGHPGASVLQCFHCLSLMQYFWLPWWLSGKESTCNAGDLGSIPGLERSPGGGNSNPLQYSCLENPTNRGAWRATVHGVAKSWT